MSKVYLTEYADIRANAALEPYTAEQTIANAVASTQFTAFNANTQFVRVHTDGIISIRFGVNPTALTSDARMAAGQTEYFKVRPGHILAVINNT